MSRSEALVTRTACDYCGSREHVTDDCERMLYDESVHLARSWDAGRTRRALEIELNKRGKHVY